MMTLEKFEEASELVKKVTNPTKLIYSEYLSAQTGAKVYLKPENMQHTGAYKIRGAYYKISIFSKTVWMQSYDCYAYSYTADQSKPYKKLWSRRSTSW